MEDPAPVLTAGPGPSSCPTWTYLDGDPALWPSAEHPAAGCPRSSRPRRRTAPGPRQHENSEPCHTTAFSADAHRQGPERQRQSIPCADRDRAWSRSTTPPGPACCLPNADIPAGSAGLPCGLCGHHPRRDVPEPSRTGLAARPDCVRCRSRRSCRMAAGGQARYALPASCSRGGGAGGDRAGRREVGSRRSPQSTAGIAR